MTINEKQDEIINDLAVYDDWMDKYDYIIQLGKELPLIDDAYKTEEHLIKGCQSKVWLHATTEGDKVVFTADSDAIITKGIISLLVYVLSGHTAKEIAQSDVYFIEAVGLDKNLSLTRANGLAAMLKQIKLYATTFDKMNQL